MAWSSTFPDPWEQLAIYQERYDIDDQLGRVTSLQRSLDRRRARAHALRRREAELEAQLGKTRHELTAIEGEVSGSNRTAKLLVEDILSRVKSSMGEVWSPTPILGFRLWAIDDAGLHGAKVRWAGPELSSHCLNRVPGEDIPHSMRRCGPPSCGIYAAKRLDVLRKELGIGDEPGFAVGVVALTGKVIEHEHGYRGANAQVRAIVARKDESILATDDPEQIGALFTEPRGTLAASPNASVPGGTDQYLEDWKEREEKWTWDPRSG